MIVEIIADQRIAAQETIAAGIEAGRNSRAVALDLTGRIDSTGRRSGGIIGLTSQQAGYVRSMRAELANLDQNYFTRQRRDARFDGIVRKAIASGKPPSQADIDRITGRYSDRLLNLRGEMIARTEGLNGYRAGNMEAMRQLVDTGKVREDQISRVWSSVLDSRTRPQHVAMEDVTVHGLSVPFTMPDGSRLMHPGDISLGAPGSQTIACRCYHRIRLRFL